MVQIDQQDGLLLSICIMTYNRADLLKITLESILNNNPGKNIEIVISDNCSVDHSAEVVSRYKEAQYAIRYFRNEINYGFDGNVKKSIERARGKYIWLFSDDDIMPDGLLKHVVNSLDGQDYNLCYVSHYSFKDGDDFGKIYKEFYPKIDKTYKDGFSLFEVAGFGFLSSLILKNSLAKDSIPQIMSIYNNAHLEVAFEIAFVVEGDYLFIGTYSVAARMPNSWNRHGFLRDGFINVIRIYQRYYDKGVLPYHYLLKLRKYSIYKGLPGLFINASVNKDAKSLKTLKGELLKVFPAVVHKLFIHFYYFISSNGVLRLVYTPLYRAVINHRVKKINR